MLPGKFWFYVFFNPTDFDYFRHWCESGDNLDGYSWVAHDGKNFGVQNLNDGSFHIETSFVKRVIGKNGGDWTNRISITAEVGSLSLNWKAWFHYNTHIIG